MLSIEFKLLIILLGTWTSFEETEWDKVYYEIGKANDALLFGAQTEGQIYEGWKWFRNNKKERNNVWQGHKDCFNLK